MLNILSIPGNIILDSITKAFDISNGRKIRAIEHISNISNADVLHFAKNAVLRLNIVIAIIPT